MIFRFVKVVPPGIEPGTQGFSVINSYVSIYLIVNHLAEYPPIWLKQERKQRDIFRLIIKVAIS